MFCQLTHFVFVYARVITNRSKQTDVTCLNSVGKLKFVYLITCLKHYCKREEGTSNFNGNCKDWTADVYGIVCHAQ